MSRDTDMDPRLHSRVAISEDRAEDATAWALIYIGDALHRLAKATEMQLDPDEVAARRHSGTKGPQLEEAA